MPLGGILVLLSLFADRRLLRAGEFLRAVVHFPAILFFIIAAAGIGCMVWFAGHANQSDAKSNWREQGVNSIAQLAVWIGMLLVAGMMK